MLLQFAGSPDQCIQQRQRALTTKFTPLCGCECLEGGLDAIQRIDPPHHLMSRRLTFALGVWQCLDRFEEATPGVRKAAHVRQIQLHVRDLLLWAHPIS